MTFIWIHLPLFTMPDRCWVFSCDNTGSDKCSLHKFPVDNPKLLKKFIAFVQHVRKDFIFTKAARICSDHFFTSDFQNYSQFIRGFVTKLILLHDAVPTVQPSKDQIARAAARAGGNISVCSMPSIPSQEEMSDHKVWSPKKSKQTFTMLQQV